MLQIGPVTIDFTPLLDAALVSPWNGAWFVFIKGGWVVFAIACFMGFKWWWMKHLELKSQAKWEWVLLAIDVPRENVQSPRAVENIMAHLAGAHSKPRDLIVKYLLGHAQNQFSLEIASINGFIRFFIYTTVKHRDLVEAAIYAQYPSAEIMETEDYTKDAPDHFPNEEWEMWGAEWILVNNQAYPIRTYTEFYEKEAEEATFKDPMAAMLETMSSLREGEQLWFQVIITPISSNSWQEASYREVAKIAGVKAKSKESWVDKILGIPGDIMIMFMDALMPGEPATDKKIKDELPSQMIYLTPGEREQVEAIEDKATKLGFHTKIRGVYLARKDVFHKPRAAHGMVGAIKQLNTEDLNSLKPELKKVGVHTKYFLREMRKNWRRVKVMRAYKLRSNWRGMLGSVMNIEELATLWHFPVAESVKTPLIKKAKSKRGEPPYELPTPASPQQRVKAPPTAKAKAAPPEELPEGGDKPPENLPVG